MEFYKIKKKLGNGFRSNIGKNFRFFVQYCDLSHKKRLLQDYLKSGAKIDRRNKQKTRKKHNHPLSN